MKIATRKYKKEFGNEFPESNNTPLFIKNIKQMIDLSAKIFDLYI